MSRARVWRVVASLVLALLCALLAGAQARAEGSLLPAWARWDALDRAWDLDGDGDFERLWLSQGRLRVEDDGSAFDSEGLWLASAAAVGDVDADGLPEVVVLAWREGRFGSYRPFWVQEDEGIFQHVYLFEWHEGALRPQWMSSGLDLEVASLSLGPDGEVRLLLTDGTEQGFVWRSWGLTAVEPAEAGTPTESGVSAEPESPEPASAELWLAGDVIPHGPVARSARFGSPDFLAQVASLTSDADLCVANLETPLAGWRDTGGLRFSADASLARALGSAGFRALCLANNHMADAGADGLDQTLRELEACGIQALGAGERFTVVEAGGLSVGLVNATYGLNGGSSACTWWPGRLNVLVSGTGAFAGEEALVFSAGEEPAAQEAPVFSAGEEPDSQEAQEPAFLDEDGLGSAVAAARERADLVVCLLHAGQEYGAAPDAQVRRWAEQAIDAGADVVVVSHPHVVQRTEWVTTAAGARGLVCWSLGNLAAYQDDPQTALGCLLHLTAQKGDGDVRARVTAAEVVPTVSHSSDGHLTVRLLEGYGEADAQAHDCNQAEPGCLTLDGLHGRWRQALGLTGA